MDYNNMLKPHKTFENELENITEFNFRDPYGPCLPMHNFKTGIRRTN